MLRTLLVLLWLIANINSYGQAVRVDHLITLTPHGKYDAVVDEYRNVGFNIKPGRTHENGLLNNHIKFSNGSSIELMTLTTKPGDNISQNYARLMAKEEKAVFVALQIESAKNTSEMLTGQGIKNDLMINKLWNYVTFPDGSDLEMLFLIEVKTNILDEPAMFIHENGITEINNVFIKGGAAIITLLDKLGLNKEESNYPDYGFGTKYHTETGKLIIINSRNGNNQWKILRVDFVNSDNEIVLVNDY